MAGRLVILTGDKPWYCSTNAGEDLNTAAQTATKSKGVRKTPAKNRAAAKGTPTVIYPAYMAAAELTPDPFWKSIFKNAALGRFPRGFRFENGLLTFKIRSKSHTIQINLDDPGKTMDDTRSFMHEKASILSDADREIREREIKQRIAENEDNEVDSWSKVRVLCHRTALILRYVNQMAIIHNLSETEKVNLETLIRICIVIGCLNATNIHLYKGTICRIDGLVRTPTGFDLDPTKVELKPRKTSKPKKSVPDDGGEGDYEAEIVNISFMGRWVKFINSLQKRTSKYRTGPDEV